MDIYFDDTCYYCDGFCCDYCGKQQATFMGLEDKPQNVDTNTCVASSYECQLNDKS